VNQTTDEKKVMPKNASLKHNLGRTNIPEQRTEVHKVKATLERRGYRE
jgi:SOS response regulatory protein OraA/RecX